jgi:hypothetical protein
VIFKAKFFCRGGDIFGHVVAFNIDTHSLVEAMGSLAKVFCWDGLAGS